MFDLAETLYAGQPIHADVFENSYFENPSRFALDMIFFPKNCLNCTKMAILRMDKKSIIMVPEPWNQNLMKKKRR